MDAIESLNEVAKSHKIATARLRAAVATLGEAIAEAIAEAGLKQAGEFSIWNQEWRGQKTDTRWIDWRGICLNGCGGLFARDFNCVCPDKPESSEILRFAEAVRNGELEKLRTAIAELVLPLTAAAASLEIATA